MKTRQTVLTTLAAVGLCTAAICGHAQGVGVFNPAMSGIPNPGAPVVANPGLTNSGFPFGMVRGMGGDVTGVGTGYGFGFPIFGSPLYGGVYVGGAGYLDPTFAVTPFGVQPIGYGYDGRTGYGYANDPDWEMLRAIYAQGYQDATNAAAANAPVDGNAANNPAGMTAAPRGAPPARVPHGSDSVRAWRVGRGEIALRWQGDARIASSVTFELTDRSGRTLRRATVSQLPAEARFTPPANAAYYLVKVHYIDGATNTIMSGLPK